MKLPTEAAYSTRLKSTRDAVKQPAVRIATIDGAMEDIIAKIDFPRAQRISLPELSSFSQNLLNVATNKADVTFAEPLTECMAPALAWGVFARVYLAQ